jgi:hypothetical protein
MKNWFLYRVYKFNKSLFIFFLFVIAATLFTNLSGWQATPFFVWGMYSEKGDRSNNHPVLKVTINDDLVLDYTDYTDANKFFLTSPLQLYIAMKKNGEDPNSIFLKRKLDNYAATQSMGEKVLNGPKEYGSFLPWYKRFLEQTTGIDIRNYKIELLQARYTDSSRMEIYSTQLIDAWKQ